MSQNEHFPMRFEATKQYPMVIPQGEPPPHFDEAGFPTDELACALCHGFVTVQAFCWGCGLYVCDACDMHIPQQDDN